MANKRSLKKEIRYICGDLAGECIIARTFIPGIDEKKMGELVVRIAELQAATLQRATFSFDKAKADFASVHEYNKARNIYNAKAFRSLTDEFNHQVDEIVKEMNKALPAAQKEANKKAAKA